MNMVIPTYPSTSIARRNMQRVNIRSPITRRDAGNVFLIPINVNRNLTGRVHDTGRLFYNLLHGDGAIVYNANAGGAFVPLRDASIRRARDDDVKRGRKRLRRPIIFRRGGDFYLGRAMVFGFQVVFL